MARMTSAERQKDYYDMRRASGKCVKACGRDARPGWVVCSPCQLKRAQWDAARYQRRKASA